MDILISKIKLGDNSRSTLRDDELGKLVSSMEQRGLLQPVGVRPDGSHYALVYGFRRFKAAQILGWKKIECVVQERMNLKRGDDLLANAAENWVRTQPSFIEQGKLFEKLVAMGMTQKSIADRVGMSSTMVRKILNTYQRVPSSVKKHITTARGSKKRSPGELSISSANTLVTMQSRKKLTKAQVDSVYKKAISEGYSSREVEQLSHEMGKGKTLSAASAIVDQHKTLHITIRVDAKKAEVQRKKRKFTTIVKMAEAILYRSYLPTVKKER